MEDPRIYASEFEKALPELLALLERLVNIDSGSYHVPGVQAVIDAMAAELSALGFKIARTPLPERGDQMTATLDLGGAAGRASSSSAMPTRSGPPAPSPNGRSRAPATGSPGPASAT